MSMQCSGTAAGARKATISKIDGRPQAPPNTPPNTSPDGTLPVAFFVRRGSRIIVLDCPYCHRQHVHGNGGVGAPLLDTRQSHCADVWKSGEYRLVEAAG
jgi:hypothetical protein